MTLQVFINGRPDDGNLTAADLARGTKLEEHTAVVDRFLSEQDGTYGWQGVLGRGGDMTVPKHVLAESSMSGDRVARVRARLKEGNPVMLVSYDPETDTPIFAEEDQEAYEAGFICAGCLQYQSVPNAPECNWLRQTAEGELDPKDRGCGHRNY